jgi:hypothetical protein
MVMEHDMCYQIGIACGDPTWEEGIHFPGDKEYGGAHGF